MRWDMLKLEMNYCFTQGSKIKFTSICLFLKENSRATKMQRMLSVQTRKKKNIYCLLSLNNTLRI